MRYQYEPTIPGTHKWGIDGRCQDCGAERFTRQGIMDHEYCPSPGYAIATDHD